MGTLNRKKPFGEVCGQAPYKYEQDGRFFDQQGREVDKNGRLIEKPQPEPDRNVNIRTATAPAGEDPKTADDGVKSDPAGKAADPPQPGNPPEAADSAGGTSDSSTAGEGEGEAKDGFGNREAVIAELDRLQVAYPRQARRSKLIEILKAHKDKEG